MHTDVTDDSFVLANRAAQIKQEIDKEMIYNLGISEVTPFLLEGDDRIKMSCCVFHALQF